MQINSYTSTRNTSPRTGGVKHIVVHYTGSGSSRAGSALANCKYFSRGDREASADFFIDDSGIWQYNPDLDNRYTWHCGDGRGRYGITNARSVGIEVCSSGEDFTEAQQGYLRDLVLYLMQRFGLPAAKVVRHYDASRKCCPEPYCPNGGDPNGGKWAALHAYITGGSGQAVVIEQQAAPSDDGRMMRYGNSGDDVRALQERLNELGYSCGAADGIFGRKTKAAVVAFQGDHGLSADGIVGPATKAALASASPRSKEPADASGGGLTVDGKWGTGTTRALQEALGTPVDGIVSNQRAKYRDDGTLMNCGYGSWQWSSSGGSAVIKAMQARIGASADGIAGPGTVRALQSYLGVSADGKCGPATVRALQERLNQGGF